MWRILHIPASSSFTKAFTPSALNNAHIQTHRAPLWLILLNQDLNQTCRVQLWSSSVLTSVTQQLQYTRQIGSGGSHISFLCVCEWTFVSLAFTGNWLKLHERIRGTFPSLFHQGCKFTSHWLWWGRGIVEGFVALRCRAVGGMENWPVLELLPCQCPGNI